MRARATPFLVLPRIARSSRGSAHIHERAVSSAKRVAAVAVPRATAVPSLYHLADAMVTLAGEACARLGPARSSVSVAIVVAIVRVCCFSSHQATAAASGTTVTDVLRASIPRAPPSGESGGAGSLPSPEQWVLRRAPKGEAGIWLHQNDREADELLKKKKKQQQQQQPPAEETRGLNPLDPIYSEYDPKLKKYVYTRYFFNPKIDLDLESPAGPMRHTDKKFREGLPLPNSANVLSVKIVSSDYGYPFDVYGTVIARDNLDRHCVYLFRRGKDNCQSITSKDNSLILNGPKRGLLLCDSIFFEIDLKIKDLHGREIKDERLGKGLLELDGIIRQTSNVKHGIEKSTLVSMHSTLDLSYAFVRNAVEGTVETRILQGPVDFHGKIVASTTSVPCDIVLHDSKVNGLLTADDNRFIQIVRRIIGVSVDEMLLVTITPEGGDEFSDCTVKFTPKLNSYDEKNIVCGNYKMQVKVIWSLLM